MKPAGHAWKNLVFEKWWTEKRGKTAVDGTFKTRGFLGD